jgi:signal transduction histidine kinase
MALEQHKSISDYQERLDALTAENKALQKSNENLRELIEKLPAQTTIETRDAQLVKYNKELEQFTYVATHDLKSPLANIQGYLDLLEIDLENPSDDVLDSLKWLKYSVAEAQQVIRELTNALKARNSKDELRKAINLEELVESVLSGMRSRILAGKVIFICDFTELNDFMYYPVALRSILQNIISNAIQYSNKSAHPEIIVSTRKIENEVHISIKDNGPGIDLSTNQAKVFGLFKRVQNDGSGSGIGMYIVNKFLENYGGRLTLDSELGKGSTFTVIIPYERI